MNLESSSESPELAAALHEIQNCVEGTAIETAHPPLAGDEPQSTVFVPIEPGTLAEAGLTDSDLESLVLKYLNAYGSKLGRKIAKHLKLPFGIVQRVLDNLKHQMFIGYKSLSAANDYEYELTEPGRERGRQLSEICSYCGAAPVGFDKYVESVSAQSLRKHRLSPKEINEAFDDLLLPKEMLAQIGQAVNSGRSIFLYGESGNGKTSVATRCVDAYDSGVWIPRTLTIGGEIIRLYDPSIHEEMPQRQEDSLLKKSVIDERWIRIKRPKVIAGGELKISELEISQNRFTGVLEAPIHMKSNNGCLVIDDFGRQRITTRELLNRWIIPLENGTDYVRLPNGRKIESPFDQMLVFSTNLEPESLGEDAFFRRIPYKVEMPAPTREQFSRLFELASQKAGFESSAESAQYLIHALEQSGHSLKYCYVDDILSQCSEFCEFHGQTRALSQSVIDLAIHNYFAGL